MQKKFEPILYKTFTFHRVKKPLQKNIIEIHEVIKTIIIDYQFYKNYQKEQLNMIDGERALKMNGIKITKQKQSFFIQMYSKQTDPNKIQIQLIHNDNRLSFNKTWTTTDPRNMIQVLGYSSRQDKYTIYNKLEVYKCQSYGLQITIYPKKDQIKYIQISSVSFLEDGNKLHNILIQKLQQFLEEDKQIDLFTLKPKALKLIISEE